VDVLKIPFESDIHREVLQLVNVTAASYLDKAHPRFAVAVLSKGYGHKLASAVGRVAKWAEQQRYVVMLGLVFDNKIYGYVRKETVDAAHRKICADLVNKPVVAWQCLVWRHKVGGSAVSVSHRLFYDLPSAGVGFALEHNRNACDRLSDRRI